MPTKTITIDVDAYNRLKKARRKDESFSEVIKRVVPMPFNFEAWLRRMERDPFSEDFVNSVERQVEGRRKPSNRTR